MGFPDINTIKPLADVLEVSVLEIMQSEREPKEEISADKATEVLDNVISLVVHQRQIERRNIIISVVSVTSVVLLIFLIDLMQWEAFVFVCMPFIFLGIGIVLIALSIHRRRMKLSYYVTLICIAISSRNLSVIAFCVCAWRTYSELRKGGLEWIGYYLQW